METYYAVISQLNHYYEQNNHHSGIISHRICLLIITYIISGKTCCCNRYTFPPFMLFRCNISTNYKIINNLMQSWQPRTKSLQRVIYFALTITLNNLNISKILETSIIEYIFSLHNTYILISILWINSNQLSNTVAFLVDCFRVTLYFLVS